MARPEIKTKQSSGIEDVTLSLSSKITGLVFWALVFIGLVLVVATIDWLEEDLRRHKDAIDDQTYILTRDFFEQKPDAINKDIQSALEKIVNSTGASGLTVTVNNTGEFTAGKISEDLNNKKIYFSINYTQDNKSTVKTAVIKIYQTPITEIISTQKKQLMTSMILLFFIFGMLLQWILKKIISAPIQDLVETAKSFSQGKHVRFNENRIDEFGYLAKFINKALDSLTQRQKELSHQASHDKLTGLYNRNEFDIQLNKHLQIAYSKNITSSLCYLDLDQFKIVNDTCGHIAGDELLKQISAALKSEIRETDFIARLGGDEFAVLLQGCNETDATKLATKLLNTVRSFQFTWEGKNFPIGVSIGITEITPETTSANDILSLADMACYTAKDNGRNQIHVLQPHDKELKRKQGQMLWVSQLKEALKNNSFALFQQTITPVSSKQNKTKNSFEILLRIPNEDGLLISPASFLGAAELYGLMTDIDIWVVEHTLKWILENKSKMEKIDHIAINLSGQSITSKECLNSIISLITENEINAEKLCFEITETSAIANISSATKFINTLKGLGCQFALDDFGSGMSSFAYLKNLNVNYLKIDGSYVRDLVNDPIDRAMVEAVNQIGHAMGIKTIAEFVEDQATLEELAIIGVDYAQGYGIAKPAPLSEL